MLIMNRLEMLLKVIHWLICKKAIAILCKICYTDYIKIKEVHYFMYGNRKLRRSNLNYYFFISIPALNFEEGRQINQNKKIGNASVNPKCFKRRNADRGH